MTKGILHRLFNWFDFVNKYSVFCFSSSYFAVNVWRLACVFFSFSFFFIYYENGDGTVKKYGKRPQTRAKNLSMKKKCVPIVECKQKNVLDFGSPLILHFYISETVATTSSTTTTTTATTTFGPKLSKCWIPRTGFDRVCRINSSHFLCVWLAHKSGVWVLDCLGETLAHRWPKINGNLCSTSRV